ncbi:MAG: hypothetical protein ABI353_12835 [Isosphaeraceae bacterium]
MAQETEAACLLKTGALYTRRIGLRTEAGGLVFAGIKRGAFSLYFDDEPIYHFDLDGRWQRAFIAGVHDRKALDGTVDAIERPREGANLVLRRRALSFAETADLDASIRGAAIALADALGSGALEPVNPPTDVDPLTVDELRELLDRISRWDPSAWFAHRERYLAAYGPMPLLPPDCHQSVVLQGTLGTVAGRAFGNAKGAEHYVRSPAEFANHCRDVATLLGRRVLQCNSVFLAGADVLRQPIEEVESILDTVSTVFPIDTGPAPRRLRDIPENEPRLDGIDAFLDDVSPPMPDAAGWRRLGDHHLRRVNLGIESGSADVRTLYGKTWSDDDLKNVIIALKDAGIIVRVLTLVGAGGVEHADGHVSATADLINALPLSKGDLVYLLDANELATVDSSSLTGQPWLDQQAALKERLAPVRTVRGAKVAPYSLEKQWN